MCSIISDCLSTHYGIVCAKVVPLSLGADINALTFRVETHERLSYFVKVREGQYSDISLKLLAFLNESGIQQIIPIIKTMDGKLTAHIENFTLSVYPFIDGRNGFSRDLSDDQWMILGKTLRQVQELDMPPHLKNEIRKETYSSEWRDCVRLLDKNIDSIQVSDEVAVKLQRFIKEHQLLINRLVRRAEYLSRVIQEQQLEFVLCHSDIHGGNVLLNEKGTLFIVDWDEPILAPKERDLMFIGGGVANVWNSPREEKIFYDGYGKTNINWSALAYYRYERIVVDIAEYTQALLLASDGGGDRQMMYKHFLDMFEPNGVVEIALKTDKALKLD